MSGALTFDPIVHQVDVQTASQVVWLDALLTNVDRTIKNTNMLMWHKELWLIDHGAALYFHHSWENWQKQAVIPDDWLTWAEEGETIQDLREVYFHFLKERVHHSELFVKEAQNARKALI